MSGFGGDFFAMMGAQRIHKCKKRRYKAAPSSNGVFMAKPVAEKLNPGINAAVRRMLTAAPQPRKPAKAKAARKSTRKGR